LAALLKADIAFVGFALEGVEDSSGGGKDERGRKN
jgi:hypothetical protein